MIDLTTQINLAQIAFGVAVIALAIVYFVFSRKTIRQKR